MFAGNVLMEEADALLIAYHGQEAMAVAILLPNLNQIDGCQWHNMLTSSCMQQLHQPEDEATLCYWQSSPEPTKATFGHIHLVVTVLQATSCLPQASAMVILHQKLPYITGKMR